MSRSNYTKTCTIFSSYMRILTLYNNFSTFCMNCLSGGSSTNLKRCTTLNSQIITNIYRRAIIRRC